MMKKRGAKMIQKYIYLAIVLTSITSINRSMSLGNYLKLQAYPSITAYDSVFCPVAIARRKNDTDVFRDPNYKLTESPKRHTITEPPFWISLHDRWFDLLRWNSIYNQGTYYEVGLTKLFDGILNNTESPGLVIDIGMNIGWFSLLSRSHGHSVAALEPNPIMHTRVCESLALNNWDKDGSVKIYQYGLGNVESIMNLTTGKNPGGSSFLGDRLAPKFRKNFPVKVVRLDDIAKQEGWLQPDAQQIHLMKIDVEGFEYFVIQGCIKIIQSGKVSNIIMENSSENKSNVISALDMLYTSGYKIRSILTVNGDPYHNDKETVDGTNMAISKIGSHSFEDHFKEIEWLIKVTCNFWWVKRK